MTAWASTAVLDNGPAYIRANCTRLHLVSTYAPGDSYATVNANTLASVTMAPADYTLANSGADRMLTSAAKTAAASASVTGSPQLQFVFTDGVSAVHWAANETTHQAVTAPNPVDFPPLTYTARQPV